MRTIVNILRLALAVVISTTGTSGAFAIAPTASPIPEGSCTIQPRSAEEYSALVGTVAPGEAILSRSGDQFHDSIPVGVPVDETTAVAITAVLADVVACVNARDALRIYALYTDHFIYAHGPTYSESLEQNLLATPSPRSPENRVWIDEIHSIEFLPDARISAIVTIGGINEIDPYPGKTFVFIFAMTSDGWRVDDQFDEIAPPDGTAPISIEEYLAG